MTFCSVSRIDFAGTFFYVSDYPDHRPVHHEFDNVEFARIDFKIYRVSDDKNGSRVREPRLEDSSPGYVQRLSFLTS